MVDLYGRESDENDVLIVPYITVLKLVITIFFSPVLEATAVQHGASLDTR